MKNTDLSRRAPFARKLSKYSAVTVGGVVGTLACFESGDAALVWSSLGESITDTDGAGPGYQKAIDLNDDTIPDVLVTVFSTNVMTAQGLNGASLAGTAVATATGSFFYPTAFQAGDVVGSGLDFGAADPAAGTMVVSFASAGQWHSGATGFLGVKFKKGINDDTHYGWVHVTWDPGTETAMLHSFAYESVKETGALVPEPSALALLGLGAMGLATRRRRQK